MKTPRVEIVRTEHGDSRALRRAHQHLLLWLRRTLPPRPEAPPGQPPASLPAAEPAGAPPEPW